MNSSNFNVIVNAVMNKSPLQKKKLQQYLNSRDKDFFDEAEIFATKYGAYLKSQAIPMEYAVSAYLEMCKNMMRCQIEFIKTGKYTVELHTEAFDNVYSNQERMKSYMIGLAISQFLWSTHYEMYNFFGTTIKRIGSKINSYLEIGPGHGLFLDKALDNLNINSNIIAVDISPVSIDITKSIMKHFGRDLDSIEFCTQDILQFDRPAKYDFITMGEVLEHVNHPDKLLRKLYELIGEEGRIFISTCVNAPAIDHVYHFKYVSEITDMIEKCGFCIEDQLILPVEDLPIEVIVNEKIAINYCAILKKF